MSDFTIRALTPETFDDFAALVERNKGMFASCWCTWFHPDDREPDSTAEDNRAFKKRLVEEGTAHAALVYDGDLAIAWAEYGTPVELPTLHHHGREEMQVIAVGEDREPQRLSPKAGDRWFEEIGVEEGIGLERAAGELYDALRQP